MVIKLQPIFFDKVWGGHKLKKMYHYDCSDHCGEAWGISAHEHGSSVVMNGLYKGLTLRELYANHRELFGNHPSDEFPVLIKVIDANDDLSIQVHPHDLYAKIHEQSLGKTECWIILDTDENTEIVIGHKAEDKEEIRQAIDLNYLELLMNRFPIQKGDQFNIYAGTIHAICKGTVLLEIQQSSDVTYRLYDYNRLDNGKPRELHVEKALDVIKVPDSELAKDKPTSLFDYHIKENHNNTEHAADVYGDFLFITEGNGTIKDTPVTKGDFLFIPANLHYEMQGTFEYFIASIK